jgi:hypothetical protein
MTMKKPDKQDQADRRSPGPSRRARLEALLFTGAALGTTVLALGAAAGPKLPPYTGD